MSINNIHLFYIGSDNYEIKNETMIKYLDTKKYLHILLLNTSINI